MNDSELLEKAKAGTITRAELGEVARALRSGDPERDPYTLIHILGRGGAIEEEALIARFLDSEDDPMLARLALQVLCDYWNKPFTYRAAVDRFLRGVYWDAADDVRRMAISIAGEMIRSKGDDSLLELLLDIFRGSQHGKPVREAAQVAIARASGKSWNELPPAGRISMGLIEVDPSVLSWAESRMEARRHGQHGPESSASSSPG